MVVHKHGDKLYDGLVNTIREHLQELQMSIEAVKGGLFLEKLNIKWFEHNKSLQILRESLIYMDQRNDADSNKIPVYQLGLNLWRDNIVRYSVIRDCLLDSLLDLIDRERTGEVINRDLIRNLIKMMKDLGSEVYEEEFEKYFLEAAEIFYNLESRQLIDTIDCADYLKMVERRLIEESERVSEYLDESKIIALVEEKMINNHMKHLVDSGLISMLADNKYSDLSRMYTLFRHVSTHIATIRDHMLAHLRETGRELVMDSERQKNPVEFVQGLLDQKDKYEKIINTSFNIDKSFYMALNSAFEYFINLNERSAEFLSLFLDDKFRKGVKGKSEEDMEIILDKVMVLFRYLQEKDVFYKYYKQHLARRLLSNRTISKDAEGSFVMKLKTECGIQYTSKLVVMLNDMETSKDLIYDFNEMLSDGTDKESPAFAVQILTMGSWPFQSGARCNLPSEILSLFDQFNAFYLNAHTGRRLSWLTNLGTANLKGTFSGGKNHELNVTTYQMCILMLFNQANGLSYKDIELETDIPSLDLRRNLQSLVFVKGKNLLLKEPMSKDISEEDVFTFNDKFISKFYKVKISTVVEEMQIESEKVEFRQKVEEDRRLQIEAAIIRILKARVALDHGNVVLEVTKLLQPHFLPNPAIIKKRIESLIEREFLERDKTDMKMYWYVA